MKRVALIVILLSLLFGFTPTAAGKCKGKKVLKKGNALYFENKFDEALDYFLKAHEKGCQDGVTQYKIFYCCMKLGDKEKEGQFLKSALSTLEREAEEKPALETYFYLANAYFSMNMKKPGIEASEKAIDLYVQGHFGKLNDSLSYFQLGKLHLDGGQREKAREFYRTSYERSKKKKDLPIAYAKMILGEIAFADYESKNYAKALEGFNQLLEIDPDIHKLGSKYRQVYSSIAISAINLGDYEQAEKAWKKVIENGLPYSEEAQYNHRISRGAMELSAVWSEVEITPADEQAKALMKDETKLRQFKHDFMVKNFKELENDSLEKRIVEISKEAKELKNKASILSDKEKPQEPVDNEFINVKLQELRRSFVFGLVEYVSRGLLVREKAIKNGFAVQVMRKDAWEVR
jgi:tetratricopeptide (TPR) repeat protein